MEGLLKSIDIFGTKFHFYINNSIKFKTWIGGIITIIISLISLSFIVIFGEDFIFRKNPYFTSSSIGENYSIINLSKEKIVIAFRLENFYGFAINSTDLIYPMIYYYSGTSNSKGEYLTEVKEEYISYKKCRDSDFVIYIVLIGK